MGWGTGSANRPCQVFALIVGDPVASDPIVRNAILERCLAVSPAAGTLGPITVFHAGGTEEAATEAEAFGTSAIIRHCYLDGEQTNGFPIEIRGLSMSWCQDGLLEGNHVHNVKCGGPYQDKTSTRHLTVRGNVYKNVARGPHYNLGSVWPASPVSLQSLVRDGTDTTLALATSSSAHGLLTGDRVLIAASPAEFAGLYVIERTGDTTFQYRMSSAPPQQQATSPAMQKAFGVDQLILEGNLIELAAESAGETAIHLDDSDLANQEPARVYGKVLLRNNKVRYVDGLFDSGYTGTAIRVNGARDLMVRDNMIEVAPSPPLQSERCTNVRYQNNRTPAGALVQGVKVENGRRYDEFETQVRDATILSHLATNRSRQC